MSVDCTDDTADELGVPVVDPREGRQCRLLRGEVGSVVGLFGGGHAHVEQRELAQPGGRLRVSAATHPGRWNGSGHACQVTERSSFPYGLTLSRRRRQRAATGATADSPAGTAHVSFVVRTRADRRADVGSLRARRGHCEVQSAAVDPLGGGA